MPTMHISDEDGDAFTIINHGEEEREGVAAADTPLPPNVNVVKPLRRADDQREHFNSASTRAPPPADPAPVPPPGPPARTILDPKFSRALDFKLRRLKEKEILQANLRRPTRYKPRNGLAASSIPNISCKERFPVDNMSRSHPQIDVIAPPEDVSPKMDKTPSPGRRGRGQLTARPSLDNDKPRFVTTVKSGQFLLPPPEVATLLGLETLYPPQEREKIVYSYASKPKALASRTKRSPPEMKKDNIPNGVVSNGTGVGAGMARQANAGRVGGALSGVRALVAGVVGLRHLQHTRSEDNHRGSGSVATQAPYSNIMHEKRVVRGATFASHPPHAAAGDGGESAAARAARTRRRAAARRAAARLRPGTPPPAPGRRHHPIQTEYYLEELFDKGVEMEVGVQTDLFVDRPATPVYVPAKTGADAATQIYPGDLFDFDLEVQPILEVLVGKTTEQALAEVAQEEELATLREQQRRYCELRDAERAERQRLAAQHTRLHTEKERRVAEARAASVAAEEARARAAAATLVQGYVAELLPAALAGLRDQGYLVERIERGVDEEFMPWLVQEVSREIESIITSRDVITEIVREVVEGRGELYRGAGERADLESPPLESVTPPSLGDLEGQDLEE